MLVPLSLVLALLSAAPLWVFAAGAAAIIPLSGWIRRATEQVAERAGPAIGGLLNVIFGSDRAGLLASLLILSVIALLLPAMFDYAERSLATTTRAHVLDERLSLGVSIVLIVVYVGNLFYTLVTHRDVFEGTYEGQATWLLPKALAVLAVATLAVAVEAEFATSN